MCLAIYRWVLIEWISNFDDIESNVTWRIMIDVICTDKRTYFRTDTYVHDIRKHQHRYYGKVKTENPGTIEPEISKYSEFQKNPNRWKYPCQFQDFAHHYILPHLSWRSSSQRIRLQRNAVLAFYFTSIWGDFLITSFDTSYVAQCNAHDDEVIENSNVELLKTSKENKVF